MGKVSRKRHSAEFKARVALEAIKGEQTLAEIGAKHGVHMKMVVAPIGVSFDGSSLCYAIPKTNSIPGCHLFKFAMVAESSIS